MDKLSIQVKIGNDSFNASGTAQQVWQAFDLWLGAIGHPRVTFANTTTPIPSAWGLGAASAQGF